ncbi:MAG TPA: RsmE family RNA methyltransferase [Candidatus Paceibacterota bacterium]|nr:RsmE family RNA methyltransferase [Candidatus Paceibacterota bacterium]
MRLHRFYIGDLFPTHGKIIIDNTDLLHQWRNVFRMKHEDQVILFNTAGTEFTCVLDVIDRKSATLSILSQAQGRKATRQLTLCAALIKKDNFDLILQKAVELGVTHIIPVISERSEKKGLNLERAARITIEASEQCGRVDVPIVEAPLSFDAALTRLTGTTAIIGFDPTGSTFDAHAFAHKSLALFIGPEGGWTEHEIDALQSAGRVLQLPTFILRAETAAIATLALATALS